MKVSRGERELSEKDLFEMPKGLCPGEWVIFEDQQINKKYVGYINPYAESFFKAKIIEEFAGAASVTALNEEVIAREVIEKKIREAIAIREIFNDYNEGARLIYGINDSLPGVIVDMYEKYILVQINTAGMDRFRTLVKSEIEKQFPQKSVLLFDNPEYRKAEVLPIHELESKVADLVIVENGLKYVISSDVIQKVGYYYDHRENRQKLANLLLRMKISKKIGLDLFSYVGSWGLHMLKAGIEKVDFVDQANMEVTTKKHLELNGFQDRGEFTRSDVFKYLDAAHSYGKKYDVIVSDPPAFTKSEKNKLMAIQGYEKLHLKVMKLLNDKSVFVVASCTHYVNYEELDRTVQDAAIKNNLKVHLLDLGVQGFDHPLVDLKIRVFILSI